MKLLVTGGAGYIGSHTAHQLVGAGHEVVVIDNLCSGFEWAVPEEADLIEGDAGDGALLEKVFAANRFDGVLHFAAHTDARESVRDPGKYYRNNMQVSLALFEKCVAHKVSHVIFSSTAAVYGEPSTLLVDEQHALNPINPYGASKMMSERILKDLAASTNGAMKFVILRYFNVAGARTDLQVGQATPKAASLIKVAAETAVGRRESISIFGTDYPTKDGTCFRDFIHVDDLARAHVDALNFLKNGGASDVFNVGYGHLFSVREVIAMMKEVSGVDFKVLDAARQAGDPVAIGADSKKIRSKLGWSPRHDDLEIICKTAFNFEKVLRARHPEV